MAAGESSRKRSGSGAGSGPRKAAHEIPDKLYFRIGEVARLCEVPAYVLRFWEGEFPQLKPNKGGTGQRLYRRRDVEMALRIKTLLYDEGYTIPGARQAFKAELRSGKDAPALSESAAETVSTEHLKALQKDLRELLAMLQKPATGKSSVQPIRMSRRAEETPAPPAPFPFPRSKVTTLKPRQPATTDLFGDLFPDDPAS